MNTNQKTWNEQLSHIASSIKNEFNVEVDNQKVITEFCNLIEDKIIKKIEFEK